MKTISTILLLFLLLNCSFDSKTGIWKNVNEIETKKNKKFKDFETLYTEEKTFNQIIEASKNFFIQTPKPKLNLIWKDEFYKNSNNTENFSYKINSQFSL